MNSSKAIRFCRKLTLTATLFGAMVTTLLIPAYGQQEVDPTWYSPWVAPSTEAVRSAQPRVAVHRIRRTAKSASAQSGKPRLKRASARPGLF
jgi:hypothetical protein